MNLLIMSRTLSENPIEKFFFEKVGNLPSSMAYIPSKTDQRRKYFDYVKNHFKKIGVQEVAYCDFDMEFSSRSIEILHESECVYLSGGMTPYFLAKLQKHNILSELIAFAKTGRPLIGVSAGALIMGENLDILLDDPEEGEGARELTNRHGLGLYDFEFWPHFGRNADDEARLSKRNLNIGVKIIGCDDYSGLLKVGDEWSVYGKVTIFDENKN
jgi:dipeptidase E